MIDVKALDIVPYPHPALRWKCKEIKITPLVKDVAARMFELMYEYKGMGLAANQVGLPWRMFVTSFGKQEIVYINPKLILGKGKKGYKKDADHEACLSLLGLNLEEKIWRARDAQVEALDLSGRKFTTFDSGLLARCWQHEVNHLDGLMFTDHVAQNSPYREFLDGWLNYARVQYEFLIPYGKGKYGTDEQEKKKLVLLESLTDA